MSFNIKFGAFIPPFYHPNMNPTVAIDDEVDFIKFLEKKGFKEAWIGEHHSGGYELISSPEIFIAHAAAKTKTIKLGTGVISLPYHNPLLVADRIVLLDHLTKGRSILGVGPGALVSDAHILGVDPLKSRDIMTESLLVINKLLNGDAVTIKNEYFELNDARLQLLPWSEEGIEIAVAGVSSDAGPKLAGSLNCSLISSANLAKLKPHWNSYCNASSLEDSNVNRKKWRIAAPMFIAESMSEAIEKTKIGLLDWLHYFQKVTTLKLINEETTHSEAVEIINKSGFGVIGTVNDAKKFINKIHIESGGFGTFLCTKHTWSDSKSIKESYNYIAEELIPYFSNMTSAQINSDRWNNINHKAFIEKMDVAINNHTVEKK
ncbi:LLM class flavin-dependent oxidoreductase [Rosenbergiella sp. S61]|uniref:LLM class flavin-dependent oxidoreductase n=1 Tax=Rosenbergiella gaditana TaxID=2726987 RepID=A0ABS5T022_9GAMM|nr:LLM class flavin-dependent oxidoreductase [Rosenbergiella gaditana]MBT0725701.1 LLM class flavin-dependent oxidoreductase [Rosenbergiella gaditana]